MSNMLSITPQVVSITGTTNQISASSPNGAVTLSTPQNIDTGASVTFANMTDSALTLGSVLFAGTGGLLSQNNMNLFWDNTNNRLGIGTNAPTTSLDIYNATEQGYLAIPTGVTATATTGGTLAAGTYYYIVIAKSANSVGVGISSAPSAIVSATVDGSTTTAVKVSWTAVPGAVTYWVYGRTTSLTSYFNTTSTSFTDINGAYTGVFPSYALMATVANFPNGGIQIGGNQGGTGYLGIGTPPGRGQDIYLSIGHYDSNTWMGTDTQYTGMSLYDGVHPQNKISQSFFGGDFNAHVYSDQTPSGPLTGQYIGGRFRAINRMNATFSMTNALALVGGQFWAFQLGSGTSYPATTGMAAGQFNFQVSGGTVTNSYGCYITTPSNSGTMINTYGLYIQSMAAGTQTNTPFSIWQGGSADINYLAGKVGIGTSSPQTTLDINGGMRTATNPQSAAYQMLVTDSTIYVTTGATVGMAITLPAASANTIGLYFFVYKVDSGVGTVAITPTGTDTLNGVNAAKSVANQWNGALIRGLTATSWLVTSFTGL